MDQRRGRNEQRSEAKDRNRGHRRRRSQYQEHRQDRSPRQHELRNDSDYDGMSQISTEPFPEYNEVEAERKRHNPSRWSMRIIPNHPAVGHGDKESFSYNGVPEAWKRSNNVRAKPVPRAVTNLRTQGNMTFNTPSDSGASSPIRSVTNRDMSGSKMMNYGVSSRTSEDVSDAYFMNDTHQLSSGPASGTHSSKVSSAAGSAVSRPGTNDKIRSSADYASFNMRMGSYDSTQLRSSKDLISDSSASSLSQGLSSFYGPQNPHTYVSASRSATTGANPYSSESNTRPHGGYQVGPSCNSNNTIWNTNTPAIYSGAGTSSYVGGPAYGTAGPSNYTPAPVHAYRATTYPPVAPRSASTMHNLQSYHNAPGYSTASGYGVQPNNYGVVGSRLNATAAEFSHPNTARPNAVDPWNPSLMGKHVCLHPGQQWNWRYLLEPGVTADWDMIVARIISSNDQQASIFLQQKIKNSDLIIKDNVIDRIIKRGLELMSNRFGNFLIQRVFECANPSQIMGLAHHIEGHTVRLSTDAFGCHVIQKAFDCVPEPFKHQMVDELLARIRDTIVHRYACHVWQKLFELRWQGPPPMIMGTVNDALIGQWTQVAVGETGSLVVQNIFENCNDKDKRPCIEEVLSNLDYVARGQYGNWCIQHICEHGSSDDRDVAINMILGRAADYSMDQYASKCIEKCLKVCGSDFLDRYLQQVLMKHPSENFSPLIQIARDQYGNFLIQWILNNASPHLREIVQAEIRKHLVSLRGNKYGSKVALICGYGPQGVRPGVPFAPAHRHVRAPVPHQPPVSTPAPPYPPQYHYHQVDGPHTPYYGPGRQPYGPGTYGPPPPPPPPPYNPY